MKKRCEQILDILNVQKFITVSELSTLIGVSPNTIRNDINTLSKEGKLQKIHGGIVNIESKIPQFPANRADQFSYRQATNIEKKRQLSQYLVNHLLQYQANTPLSIFIDGSTTNIYIAKEISTITDRQIIVITNFPELLPIFHNAPNISVILLGGAYWKNEQYTIGSITSESIKQFHADIAIFGVSSIYIEPNKVTSYDMHQDAIAIKTLISEHSKEVWIGCDSTKFNQKSLFYCCTLTKKTKIFTNTQPVNFELLTKDLQKQFYYF